MRHRIAAILFTAALREGRLIPQTWIDDMIEADPQFAADYRAEWDRQIGPVGAPDKPFPGFLATLGSATTHSGLTSARTVNP